jgi:hypothetical protein
MTNKLEEFYHQILGNIAKKHKIVIRKINNEQVLVDVFNSTKHQDVRIEALNKINDNIRLRDIVKSAKYDNVRILAIEKISDEDILSDIAKNTENEDIYNSAIEKISDEDILSDIAKNTKDENIHKIIIETGRQLLLFFLKPYFLKPKKFFKFNVYPCLIDIITDTI